MNPLPSRRDALKTGAALVGAALVPPFRGKRVASLNTAYYLRSHSYHIAGRFLHGYPIHGVHHQPEWKLVRMFNDQYPANDLSRSLATKFGFEISETVAAALGGPGGLDVDAVLLVGEHGEYPTNEFGQKLYPRHRLFMEVVDYFRKCGKSVPVFNDKHLSYDTRLAKEMVAASRELKFGFMAGSSLPVTWRRPELEPAIGTPITEGLVCGYSGGEAYMFHCLESLQVMMERRSDRETGVRAVTALRGDAVWKAGDDGRWSKDLLEAALSRSPSRNYGVPKDNCPEPWAFLIEYKDGSRGACLQLSEHVADFTFAGRVKGQKDPISTLFELPAPPGARYFSALTYNIEKLFATGKSPYPVERTLLTGAVLEYGLRSLAAGGKRLEDPSMEVAYSPPADSGYFQGSSSDM
ncbi:MAG TPA: hypothetical protein VG457_08955 [Planctomycetota bacterium]|jgi:hypothetical protein|nr:hypothetical protein [Planctomycetota bacterium]